MITDKGLGVSFIGQKQTILRETYAAGKKIKLHNETPQTSDVPTDIIPRRTVTLLQLAVEAKTAILFIVNVSQPMVEVFALGKALSVRCNWVSERL